MKVRYGTPAALAGLLALAGAALPAAAQDQQPPQSVFGETIDVRVVNVEVVVTDRDGNRVSGLGPQDFRLRVDGKETPIDYFNEVRGGIAVAPEAAGSSVVPGIADLAPGSPVGTSYLVFIDDYFTISSQRDAVLRALKDDLARLAPEDRMAIVAFDGSGAEMLSTWSSSQNQLERAFDKAMGRRTRGLERLAELRSFDSTRRPLRSGAPPGGLRRFETRLSIEELQFAQTLASQVERSVSAAVMSLRGFAAPPGRKVMLLLSGGWPYSVADYVVNSFSRPLIEREVPSGEQLLQPLADTANRLGYTIYSVDVPGLMADTDDIGAAGADSGSGIANLREREVHAALEFVADRTGGRPLINGLRQASLETASTDTRSYYWLGFTPQRQGDDRRHDVDVEVLRPGLRVRSRDSFLDSSRQSEVTMMVESALLFGSPPGTGSLGIQVGEPQRVGRREIDVPLMVAIPADQVSIVPVGGKHQAELELRVAVVDERGDRANVPVIALRLVSDEAPQPGAFLGYKTTLRLRRIGQHLVVAVFDPLSGKLLTAEADVAPGG